MSLLIKKLHEDATIPSRGTEGSAGYDVSSVGDFIVEAKSRKMIPTGLAMRVPPGTYGRIASRSGLACRHGITVITGTIDSDYTGQVFVVLYNTSDEDYVIKKGDRVAQLILEKIETPDVAVVIELSDTARSTGGFGSTGY